MKNIGPEIAVWLSVGVKRPYAFYAFCYIISLNINTEELSRYVAKVVPVNEITDSKLPFFQNRKIRV
jgi:hypothetical protein